MNKEMKKQGTPIPIYKKIRHPETGCIIRQELDKSNNAPVLLYQEFFFPSAGISAVGGRDFHSSFPSTQYHQKGHEQNTSQEFLTTVFRQGFLHSIIVQRTMVSKQSTNNKLKYLASYTFQTVVEKHETLMYFFGGLIDTSPLMKKLYIYYLREKIREEKTKKYNKHLFYVLLVLTFFVNLLYSVYWSCEENILLGKRFIQTRTDALSYAVQIVKNAWYTHEVWTGHMGSKKKHINTFSVRQFLYLLFPKLEYTTTRKIISMGQHGTDILYPGDETEKKRFLAFFEDLILYDVRALSQRVHEWTGVELI